MKQLINVDELNLNRITNILDLSKALLDSDGEKYNSLCLGKILSIVFLNESLRTSAILKAAMYKLGGNIIEVSNYVDESSLDVFNSILPLSDLSAIRADYVEFDDLNSRFNVPLINSLCNRDEHSLSSLWHLLTMDILLNGIKGKKVGIYGQTAHCRAYLSLQKLLSKVGCDFYIDPVMDELGNPNVVDDYIVSNGASITKCNIADFISKVDVLLISDGQPMGGSNNDDNQLLLEYSKRYKVFDEKLINKLPDHAIANYMMPRKLVDERSTIDESILNHEKFYNSKMMDFGVYSTMALIIDILGLSCDV